MRSILFIELLGGIGDVLIALPAIQALGRTYPTAKLTVLTFAPGDELIQSDPLIHAVIAIHQNHAPHLARTAVETVLNRDRFDLIVSDTNYDGIEQVIQQSGIPHVVTNLWRSPPPDQRVGDRFLQILQAEGFIKPEHIASPQLHLLPAESHHVQQQLSAINPPLVILYADAGMAIKRWSTAKLVSLGRALQQQYQATIVVPIGSNPEQAAQIVTAIGGTAILWAQGTLRELAALMATAALVIAPDTGPARIAAALHTPTITLFGPSWHDRYGQPTPHINLQGYPDCPERDISNFTLQRCWYDGECPFDRWHTCLEAISPADVLAAAAQFLEPSPSSIDPNPESSRTNAEALNASSEHARTHAEVSSANLELSSANLELLSANLKASSVNPEVSSANLELSSANLELLSENLEASSTNPEVSSANLELSSANLKALNADLNDSSTNPETSSTNLELSSANLELLSANLKALSTNPEASSTNPEVSSTNLERSSANLEASRTNPEVSSTNVKTSSVNLETSSAILKTQNSKLKTHNSPLPTPHSPLPTPNPSPSWQHWSSARNILVMRLDNIGDVLMTSPALRTIKETLPSARLTLMASPGGSQAAALLPWVNEVLPYRALWQDLGKLAFDPDRESAFIQTLRDRQFDAAIIFTSFSQTPHPAGFMCYMAGIPLRLGQSKEWGGAVLTTEVTAGLDTTHQVERNLRLIEAVGFQVSDRSLRIQIPPADQQTAMAKLLEQGLKPTEPYILLNPWTSCQSRNYAIDRFAIAAQQLADKTGYRVVVTGVAGDRSHSAPLLEPLGATAIDLIGHTTLSELAALIANAKLMVSNNTSTMHLADATRTPSVILFAGTEYESQWQPRHTAARLLRQPTECSPCYAFTCPFNLECLDLAPEAVVEAGLALLRNEH